MTLSIQLKHSLDSFTLDLGFDAPKGITVLYGRSGSGKTTIINAVAGLFTPTSGRISADGTTLFDSKAGINLPPHKRRVGYVFQEARLFPHLTVRQNLIYGRWYSGQSTKSDDVGRVVDMLGIGSLLDRQPNRLSGGEKQRVAIGRALLADPQIILADEPLTALDSQRKEEILPYFERLRDQVDIPILYVSHSASEVTRLATTVVAIEAGRILRQGPAVDVLSDPQVTPLGAQAAGSLLRARVHAHHPDGISEVHAKSCALLLPKTSHPIGTELRIRVEAQDVMIATSPPEGISALNVLEAEIVDIRMGDGPGALVQLDAGGNLILSRITRRSLGALKLEKGSRVFAVLKAVSIPPGAIGDRYGATE